MTDSKELATHLVDKLFQLGDDVSFGKVWRIQFMTGEYLNEQGSGGMSHEPLVRFFTKVIEDYNEQQFWKE